MKREKIIIFAPMNERSKISVVINTYNAARFLREVLESVKDFDEVLICDMESTDTTLDIAREYGCKIVTFPKADHKSAEPARTFAIQSAACHWVVVVDADEIVTPQLRACLYHHIQQENAAEGLYIPRLNKFMGKTMACAYPDYHRTEKDRGHRLAPGLTADDKEKLQTLLNQVPKANRFVHGDFHPGNIMEKDNRYSDNDVEKKAHKNYGAVALLWRPFWRFFKCYVLEGGWRDGVHGLIYAGLKGVYQFELVAKIIEKRVKNE